MSQTMPPTDDTEEPAESSVNDSTTPAAESADPDAPRVDSAREGPRVATITSITAVAFAVGAMAIGATYAVPLALLAAVGVAVGVVRQQRTLLGWSTAAGVGTVLVHGLMGGGPLGTVLAAGLFVFAWDQTDHAMDLDAQLGPDAVTYRGELAHAAYSFFVFVLVGGGAYALAFVAQSRRPLPALVLLLLGGLLLTAAIRDR